MKNTPSYYAVIPAGVRYDPALKPNEKLLYGEITSLTHKDGYCWASNSYFAELYGVGKKTVSSWINSLANKGYLRTEIITQDNQTQANIRKIFLLNDLEKGPPSLKKRTPLPKKRDHNSKENNKDLKDIVDFINSKYRRGFRVNKDLLIKLAARKSEKYTMTEIKMAIVNAHSDEYHKSTNFKYLTPEFILRSSMLEKWLNANKNVNADIPEGYAWSKEFNMYINSDGQPWVKGSKIYNEGL